MMFFENRLLSAGYEATDPSRDQCGRYRLGTRAKTWLSLIGVLLALLPATDAGAGISGSDVVVAVNGGSMDSRTLANHYVALRKIPAVNVIVLDGVPNSNSITVDAFRREILNPLMAEIDRRRLASHIQCIVYSADFPTAINITSDLKPLGKLPKIFTPQGSINGLTYLFSQVQRSVGTYIDLNANCYARRPLSGYFDNPGGDRTRKAWSEVNDLISGNQHAEAADALEAMLQEQPHQFPVAYLAAAEAAQANETRRALRLLESAIAGGWNLGHYLANDSRFESLRDEPEFQVLELILDPTETPLQVASGFDSRKAWTPNGLAVSDRRYGFRYVLSMVLGVTRGGGTTLAEAIAALERSTRADFTHPQGTFYFSVTDDVRTKTRQPGFADTIKTLRQMGFGAEQISDSLPKMKDDVLGAQIGKAFFDWPSSGSRLVPGSIAENLTSLGGVMTIRGSHTKLTELIKAGAAGSSGTVTEPYALQSKFPHPQLYVHYAHGASLAEAFYLSVTCPYQLLIVGDPLCRPFSHAPQPTIDTAMRFIEAGEKLNFTIDLSGPRYEDWLDDSSQRSNRKTPLAAAEISLLFDGAHPRSDVAKPKVAIAVQGEAPGYHEVTLRFTADDPLSQRSEVTIPVWIGEKELVTLSFPKLDTPAEAASGGPNEPKTSRVSIQQGKLSVAVRGVAAERVSLWHDEEQLGFAAGSEAEFSIPLESLGMGPVRLQARAEMKSGLSVRGIPSWIEVTP